jgi:hypothetical protein
VISSAKYNRKTRSGLELSFRCGTSLHFTDDQRAMSIVKWMVSGPVDLAHSEKLPLHQRHLNELLDA